MSIFTRFMSHNTSMKCPNCNGRGLIDNDTHCDKCEATGQVQAPKESRVRRVAKAVAKRVVRKRK